MSERNLELLHYYKHNRIDDQLAFYSHRRSQSQRASGQTLILSGMLLGVAAVTTVLAATHLEWDALWSILAIILPAASSAFVAYAALFDFDQQARIFGNAGMAIQAASRPRPDPYSVQGPEENAGELVVRVESALRQELAEQAPALPLAQIDDEMAG